MSDPTDWLDDDNMPSEKTLERFQQLNPEPTVGPLDTEPGPQPYDDQWREKDWVCPHNAWGCNTCFPYGGRP